MKNRFVDEDEEKDAEERNERGIEEKEGGKEENYS